MFIAMQPKKTIPSSVGAAPSNNLDTCSPPNVAPGVRPVWRRLLFANRLKNIALIVVYLELLKKFQILLSKRPSSVVLYLIPDVTDYIC